MFNMYSQALPMPTRRKQLGSIRRWGLLSDLLILGAAVGLVLVFSGLVSMNHVTYEFQKGIASFEQGVTVIEAAGRMMARGFFLAVFCGTLWVFTSRRPRSR